MNKFLSQSVVQEMVRGVLERSDADIALGITGFAGPGGGTKETPLETVWIGQEKWDLSQEK